MTLVTTLIIFCLVTFLVNQLLQNNSLMDIFWGIGYVVVAFSFFLLEDQDWQAIDYIVISLIVLWAMRLSLHILFRQAKSGFKEDWRYAKWRKAWLEKGKLYFYVRSFLQVNLLQSVLIGIIALPVISILIFNEVLNYWDYVFIGLGVFTWIVGFYFEAVGDYQLDKFLKERKDGELMKKGLWSLTRHPNYFGEITMWWGIWIISLINPYSITLIISPLLLNWLILKVSGVPMLEEKYKDREDFQEYKEEVPKLVPKLSSLTK